MAAHSVNILLELANKLRVNPPSLNDLNQLDTALGYAPGMDELGLDDWRRLNDCCKDIRDRLRKIEDGNLNTAAKHRAQDGVRLDLFIACTAVLSRQIAKWIELGFPRYHEEWFSRKYSKETQ